MYRTAEQSNGFFRRRSWYYMWYGCELLKLYAQDIILVEIHHLHNFSCVKIDRIFGLGAQGALLGPA